MIKAVEGEGGCIFHSATAGTTASLAVGEQYNPWKYQVCFEGRVEKPWTYYLSIPETGLYG